MSLELHCNLVLNGVEVLCHWHPQALILHLALRWLCNGSASEMVMMLAMLVRLRWCGGASGGDGGWRRQRQHGGSDSDNDGNDGGGADGGSCGGGCGAGFGLC
ncbi:Hypothetical predicted protein [Olea europaea subsp. europaea]|uniref:Uncharacterized protein n=1 Tax=Olea europaea subsp. europaea TaxID=158383 RepID=A0A8S0RKB4_OLEEU|nr:Hypothetical predicted protein [Olea europaea subsp. europaea]